jgi:hypothetical protein
MKKGGIKNFCLKDKNIIQRMIKWLSSRQSLMQRKKLLMKSKKNLMIL